MRSLVASSSLSCSLLFLVLLAACGGGGSGRRCEAPEGPGWCFCYDDADRVAQDEVTTCDLASVSLAGTTSLCCEDADGQGCECNAFGCYQESAGYCACGRSIIHGQDGAARVSTCFAEAQGDHCCLDPVFNDCRCSILTCSSNEVEVSLCGVPDVITCGSQETTVDSCK
jgi:hypothetical protein